MPFLLVLAALAGLPLPPDPPDLTGIVDTFLTAGPPETPADCVRATRAEIAQLPRGADRGRVWRCTLLCHLPSQDRAAMLITRRWQEPVIFIDVDRDGAFSLAERYEFRGKSDLLVRLPYGHGRLQALPIFLRYRWELFKQPRYPERRMILQSVVPHFAGRVWIDGRMLRVQYPMDLDTGAPASSTGWIRVDVNGDGLIDPDPLSAENTPPRSEGSVIRVGKRYVSTERIDPDSGVITLREHPASAYRRVELRVGDQLADFSYVDLEGAPRKLSDIRSRLTLLMVWDPWCPPAIAELVRVQSAYRKLAPKGLAVLGLLQYADREKVRPVLEGLHITWPNADSRSVEDLLRNRWQISAVPLFIALDGERRIVKLSRPGDLSLRGARLRRTLEKLLR